MNKRILIAVPTAKYIETKTFKSIYDLHIPEGYTVDFESFFGYNVDQVRNLIAHHAITANYDYVLFIDSDISFTPESLSELLMVEGDIVTGVYRQRFLDKVVPEIYVDLPGGGTDNIDPDYLNEQMEPFEIAGCGFGYVLVKVKVMKDIGYPQFFYKHSIEFEDTVSEDTYFCEKAKKKGYKIICNPLVQCGHIGNFEIYFKKWH